MSNLFINIDQSVDIKEYEDVQNYLFKKNVPFLECLEGIFIEDFEISSEAKKLYNTYKETSDLTNNKPIVKSDNFYTTYDLAPNYYAIIKKQNLDIEKTFKNFLYHIKDSFKYGFYIDWKTLRITYDKDKGQVIVNFFYTLNTANKNNIKGIQQYLKSKYRSLLRKYNLIKNEH